MTGGESAGILRLFGRVRDYGWGSPTAIYDLLGEDPSGRPAAELWLGTHPNAPSEIETGGQRRPAEEAVGRLPFLLKVLAADKALSLQVHPDRTQAQAGFDGEERAGVPPDAPHRRYRDRNHKPELIVALTPFRALAGIRDPQRTLRVVQDLGHPPLASAFEPLREDPSSGAATVLRTLLTMPAHRARGLVDGIVGAAGAIGPRADPDVAAAADLIVQLAAAHPGDIGIAAALLLNDVLLQPGEALFQPARLLHAYVHGVGIEIMATSDNVLRGGLTPKHVDVDELLRILDPTPTGAPVLTPRTVRRTAGITVRTWDAPVDDFALTEAVCDGTAPDRVDPDGNIRDSSITIRRPAILLVTDGTVTVAGVDVRATRLRRGQAAVVAPAPGATGAAEVAGVLTLSGQGRVFLASSGSCTPS